MANSPIKKNIFLIAGEPSGDLHGANLIQALKTLLVGEETQVSFSGIGGPLMEAQGLKSIYPMEQLSVVGLVEVLSQARQIVDAFKRVKYSLKTTRPDLVIFIDYPGFNLRILKYASRIGLRTMYYITPQVWAWKRRRAYTIKKYCDVAAVILPFEEDFFRKMGVKATFVGHPLLDSIKVTQTKEAFLHSLGLDPQKRTIGFLPGSRRGEVNRHLGIMLDAIARLKSWDQDHQFLMPITNIELLSDVEKTRLDPLGVKLIIGDTYNAMASCDFLVLASGTVTLEASILGVPHVVIYRLSPITYFLARILVKVPFVSLTNLVAGKRVVHELLQGEATGKAISRHVIDILSDISKYEAMKMELQELKGRLGPGGAPLRAAELALSILNHPH